MNKYLCLIWYVIYIIFFFLLMDLDQFIEKFNESIFLFNPIFSVYDFIGSFITNELSYLFYVTLLGTSLDFLLYLIAIRSKLKDGKNIL
jgi:hypothetical protein